MYIPSPSPSGAPANKMTTLVVTTIPPRIASSTKGARSHWSAAPVLYAAPRDTAASAVAIAIAFASAVVPYAALAAPTPSEAAAVPPMPPTDLIPNVAMPAFVARAPLLVVPSSAPVTRPDDPLSPVARAAAWRAPARDTSNAQRALAVSWLSAAKVSGGRLESVSRILTNSRSGGTSRTTLRTTRIRRRPVSRLADFLTAAKMPGFGFGIFNTNRPPLFSSSATSGDKDASRIALKDEKRAVRSPNIFNVVKMRFDRPSGPRPEITLSSFC
mmetsp:Transcript_38000/g.103675  ORF Transcript_38000/g.103675 Transcript_38000/m.103675 type:complete len:272 (-) Transcript_38000:2173-2988(-)